LTPNWNVESRNQESREVKEPDCCFPAFRRCPGEGEWDSASKKYWSPKLQPS
jgi:hypothetical protein